MSVSKWRYTEECDGKYCCGDCDLCDKEPEESEESNRMKYINANDVYDGMRKHGFEAQYITRGEFVDHLPSADVRENIHGEWKPERTRFGFYCSKCKMYSYWQTDFCPNCGANMRG